MNSKLSHTVFASILITLAVGGCYPRGTGDMPARKLIANRCSACHSTKRIFKEKRSKETWDEIIDRMIRHGASLNSKEKEVIKDYLSTEYGTR